MAERKDINISTLLKIKEFLREQDNYIFKSEIVKKLGVDYDSLNYALDIIKAEYKFMYDLAVDEDGRILLCWK